MHLTLRLNRSVLAATVSDPPVLRRLPEGSLVKLDDLPAHTTCPNAEVRCFVDDGTPLLLFVADLHQYSEPISGAHKEIRRMDGHNSS